MKLAVRKSTFLSPNLIVKMRPDISLSAAGTRVVMWKKDRQILTMKNQVMKDQPMKDRLRLLDGYNLQISQAKPSDAGVYTCAVALSDRDLKQTQTLDVQCEYGLTMYDAGV